ncbi:MAG: heme ABC exporter ATP-binding protein CcmA [Acidobacteria bacterium]|nr:heme ABC exporter ATP-binding protein CcmA [Acidobacteriota bacterium]MBI3472355.1 heme ABC exporter ATP-binding protein CcmA [Candidatus Solibacter usitatus]
MIAVAVEDVWKFFGDYPALREISFTVEPGECLALLGRNGAGKTTLLRIIAGFSPAGRGQVRVFGRTARAVETRRLTGVLGHGIAVYDELSAIENLTLFGKLYGLADPERAAREWLERTGLERVAHGLVREFSRGMRQRLAIARAFLHDPKLLLFDEPFTSLDDRAIAVLQSVLRDGLLRGCTIVMSTHQLREAMELATHVALLNQGRMVHRCERPPEMLSDPGWLYARYGDL